MATPRFIVWRCEPLHDKIDDLWTKMKTSILDINTKLCQQYCRIVDKTFFMMNFTANFFLACVWQLFSKYTGICHSKARDDLGRIVGMNPVISFTKKLILIILSLIAKKNH